MDDDSSSTMTMVFSPWSTYKISLLFASWKCSTKLEFALTWFVVVFAAIGYHAFRYLVFMIEDYMHSESSSTNVAIRNIRQEDTLVDGLLNGYQFNSNISENSLMAENKERESLNPTHALEGSHKKSSIGENDEFIEASRYLLLRLLHSIFSGLNYGMALMLMLVAMTFNPSLFLALVIGYSIGDFVFFVKMRPQSSMSDCH